MLLSPPLTPEDPYRSQNSDSSTKRFCEKMSVSEKNKPLKKRKYFVTGNDSDESSTVSHTSPNFSLTNATQDVTLLNSPPQTPPTNTTPVTYYSQSMGCLPKAGSPYAPAHVIYPSPGQSPMDESPTPVCVIPSHDGYLPATVTPTPRGPSPCTYSHVPTYTTLSPHYTVSKSPGPPSHSLSYNSPISRHVPYSTDHSSPPLPPYHHHHNGQDSHRPVPRPPHNNKDYECSTAHSNSNYRQPPSLNQNPKQGSSSNAVIPKNLRNFIPPDLLSQESHENKSAEPRESKKKSPKDFVYFVNNKRKPITVLSRIFNPRKYSFPTGEPESSAENIARKNHNRKVETIDLENDQNVPSSHSDNWHENPDYYNDHRKNRQEHVIKRPIPINARCVPNLANSLNEISESTKNMSDCDHSRTTHTGRKQQTCKFCANHGHEEPMKGHKYSCPYREDCTCDLCCSLRRKHIAIRSSSKVM